MEIAIVLALIPLSAALTIYGELRGRRALVYVCKPLTTAPILALAAMLPADPSSRDRTAILVGLLCSLAGDVFLMLPADRVIAGVAALLAAHLAYLAAFTSEVPFAASPMAFAAVAAVVVAILIALWRHLPSPMRVPLLVYAVVLGAMAAQAISQAVVLGLPAAFAGRRGGSALRGLRYTLGHPSLCASVPSRAVGRSGDLLRRAVPHRRLGDGHRALSAMRT